MKVQMVMLMMPSRAPHPDAQGATHFVQPSQPRAGGRERYVHTPRRVSRVSARRTCLETPVPIGFQANGVV
jgi:hypothetical protein